MKEFQRLKETKKGHRDELMSLPNVVGVGVGYKITDGEYTDTPSVRIYVERKVPLKRLKKSERVPPKIQDVLTDVIDLGGTPVAAGHTSRERPARGGANIGYIGGFYAWGTLGGLFLDGADEVLLSNNHIIANIDDVDNNYATVGDPIIQPGLDGSDPDDRIATLKRWVEFEIQPTYNRVDAAIAEIISPGSVSSDIHEIGVPTGYRTLTVSDVGAQVQKSGAKTGYTMTGEVFDVASDVTVSYASGNLYNFEDQLLIQVVGSNFTEGGDSGSLVLDMDNKVVGLLFAHIEGSWAWCSPISWVLSDLSITGISKSWPRVTLFIGGVDVTRY